MLNLYYTETIERNARRGKSSMDRDREQVRSTGYGEPGEEAWHHTSRSSRPYEDYRPQVRESYPHYTYDDQQESRYERPHITPARGNHHRAENSYTSQYDRNERAYGYDEHFNNVGNFSLEERRGYQEDSRHDEHRYQHGPHDDHIEDNMAHHEQHHANEVQDQPRRRSAPPLQLRLVKLASDVLPDFQRVAVIDGRSGIVSIGRDRISTPRIRCPSMEVSKNHANIFKMTGDQRGRPSDSVFAITDTGSTHGTHLLLDPPTDLNIDSLPPVKAYQRLSPPKKASLPKTLRHMCLLRIGQTVFQAHLHSGTVTCSDCTLNDDGSNEIPLLVKEAKSDSQKSDALNAPAATPIVAKLDPQEALKALKSRHLGDDSDEILPATNPIAQYIDRAAARRARGGTQHQKKSDNHARANIQPPKAQQLPAPIVASAEAAKLDASNRGFKMFEAMAAKSMEGSVSKYDDPIMARGVEGTAGLGTKRLLDVQEMANRPSGYSAESIRERQRRRFEESRGDT